MSACLSSPPLALSNFRYRHSLLVRQLAAVLWRCWRCCCCCCCFVSAPASVAPSFPLSAPTFLPGAKAEGSGVMVLLLQPAGECPPVIERRVHPPADSVAFPRAYARTGDDCTKKATVLLTARDIPHSHFPPIVIAGTITITIIAHPIETYWN